MRFSNITEGEKDLKITGLGKKKKQQKRSSAEHLSRIRLRGRDGSTLLSLQLRSASAEQPRRRSSRAERLAALPRRSSPDPQPQPQPLPSGGTDRARSAAPAAGTRPGAGAAALYSRLNLRAAPRAPQRCPEPRPRPPRCPWSPAARPRCRWCCCCWPPVSAASRELRRGLGGAGSPRRDAARRTFLPEQRPAEPPVRGRAARSCRAGVPLLVLPLLLNFTFRVQDLQPDCSLHVGQPPARQPRRAVPCRAVPHRRHCSRQPRTAQPRTAPHSTARHGCSRRASRAQ